MIRAALILALALPLAASAAPAGKVGLGLSPDAQALESTLLELIGDSAEAVVIAKAPPKGAKRKAWAKAAEKSQGLFVGGKPIAASGADLKGGKLEGSGKTTVKTWLANNLSPGAARTAPVSEEEAPDEEEEAPAKPPVATAPVADAPIRGPGGRKSAAPVVAPPPPPASEPAAEEPTRVADAPPPDSGDGRDIASKPEPSGPSGPHGGGYLGGSLSLAPGMGPFLRARVEFSSVGRGFNYNDPVTSNLRPYSVTFMPTPGVGLELYPLTLSGNSALAGLAVTFGFKTSLGVSSARANSNISFPTTYSSWDVGALYRIQLGDGFDSFALIPSISWSSTSFDLAAVEGVREDQLPNVSYSGLRLGFGFDSPLFSIVRLTGNGAFLLVGTPGEIISDTFFKVGSVNGLEGKIGLGFDVLEHVAFELGLTYQHFFYAFKPEVGDAFVAGGALDQFVVGRAAVRIDL